MDLTSGQNTESSNQIGTSEKPFNVAGRPLLLAELLSLQFNFRDRYFLADAEIRLMVANSLRFVFF